MGEPSLAHVTCDVVHGAVQLNAQLYRAHHPAIGESDRVPRPAVRDVAESRPVHFALAAQRLRVEAVLEVSALRALELDSVPREAARQLGHAVGAVGHAPHLLDALGDRPPHALVLGALGLSLLGHVALGGAGLPAVYARVRLAAFELLQAVLLVEGADGRHARPGRLAGRSFIETQPRLDVRAIYGDMTAIAVRVVARAVFEVKHEHAFVILVPRANVFAGIFHAELRGHLSTVATAFVRIKCHDLMFDWGPAAVGFPRDVVTRDPPCLIHLDEGPVLVDDVECVVRECLIAVPVEVGLDVFQVASAVDADLFDCSHHCSFPALQRAPLILIEIGAVCLGELRAPDGDGVALAGFGPLGQPALELLTFRSLVLARPQAEVLPRRHHRAVDERDLERPRMGGGEAVHRLFDHDRSVLVGRPRGPFPRMDDVVCVLIEAGAPAGAVRALVGAGALRVLRGLAHQLGEVLAVLRLAEFEGDLDRAVRKDLRPAIALAVSVPLRNILDGCMAEIAI